MAYLVNGKGPYELPKLFIYRVFYYPLGAWLLWNAPLISWVLVNVLPDGTCQYLAISENDLREQVPQLPIGSDVVDCSSLPELQRRLGEDLRFPYNILDKAAKFVIDALSITLISPLIQKLGGLKLRGPSASIERVPVEFVLEGVPIRAVPQYTWTVPLLPSSSN